MRQIKYYVRMVGSWTNTSYGKYLFGTKSYKWFIRFIYYFPPHPGCDDYIHLYNGKILNLKNMFLLKLKFYVRNPLENLLRYKLLIKKIIYLYRIFVFYACFNNTFYKTKYKYKKKLKYAY